LTGRHMVVVVVVVLMVRVGAGAVSAGLLAG
jgi:hypothetical protein